MKTFVLPFLAILVLLLPNSIPVEARCINPVSYLRTTVGSTKYYPRAHYGGTAWFYASPRTLVTSAHVARKLFLTRKWTKIQVKQDLRNKGRANIYEVSARLKRIGGIGEVSDEEIVKIQELALLDYAILELKNPLPFAQTLNISPAPPELNDFLATVAYPEGKLIVSVGRALPPIKEFGSLIHLGMNNQKPVLNGSSGAPILNCRGRAVGIMESIRVDAGLSF